MNDHKTFSLFRTFSGGCPPKIPPGLPRFPTIWDAPPPPGRVPNCGTGLVTVWSGGAGWALEWGIGWRWARLDLVCRPGLTAAGSNDQGKP